MSSDNNVSDFDFKGHTTLAHIPINKIRENVEALRTVVDKTDEKYLESLDSVKKRGIMNPILVREIKDPTNGEIFYGLIDGLHRFNWALDAGLETIPAHIGSLDDADLLEAQILANVHKIETRPVQYTKALLKIMGVNPLLTKAELSSRLSKSPSWLNDRLQLVKLTPEIQTLVDNGTIGLANAYALSKLPADKQKDLVEAACSQSPAEFVPTATNTLKEIQAAKRQGRAVDENKFVPVPRLQRPVTLKDELGFMESGQLSQSKIALLVDKYAGKDPIKAAILATQFALHLDPETITVDEANWRKKRAEEEENKKKREEEKKAKKEEAARKAVEAANAKALGKPEVVAAS